MAETLRLRGGDRVRLEELIRAAATPSGVVERARIVLLAADGVPNAEIARRTMTSRSSVVKWRDRYLRAGIDGLTDLPRQGRRREVDEIEIIAETLADAGEPPPELGVPNWSSRLLATRLDISFATVARTWRKWNLHPRTVKTFTFPTCPELEPTIRDVLGLYLDPASVAVVVRLSDEPVAWTANHGRSLPSSHRGPTALFAALENALDRIGTEAAYPRRTDVELLTFLERVADTHGWGTLHVVCDDHHAGGEHSRLAKNPSVVPHVATADCSWLRLVKVFFSILACQATRRGHPYRVDDLEASLRRFPDHQSEPATPFIWIKPAD